MESDHLSTGKPTNDSEPGRDRSEREGNFFKTRFSLLIADLKPSLKEGPHQGILTQQSPSDSPDHKISLCVVPAKPRFPQGGRAS